MQAIEEESEAGEPRRRRLPGRDVVQAEIYLFLGFPHKTVSSLRARKMSYFYLSQHIIQDLGHISQLQKLFFPIFNMVQSKNLSSYPFLSVHFSGTEYIRIVG